MSRSTTYPDPPRVTARPFAEHGVCVQAQGELDLLAAPLLRDAISAAITAGHRHIVIDLRAATLLDCACLGTILAGMRPLATDDDASLVFAGANGQAARLLDVLDIAQTCPVVASIDEATQLALRPAVARAEGWRKPTTPATSSTTDDNPQIEDRR